MKVLKFNISNYKCLQGEHEFEPGGSSFFVIGANGTGKTSVTHTLIDILLGNLPQKPVTTGEKEGFFSVTLDDGKEIHYKFFDTGKYTLELITADGITIKKPSDIFAVLAGPGMKFNIDEFINMQPKPRRLMLEKITGVDLSSLNAEELEAEGKRKSLKQSLKEAESRVVVYDEELVTAEPVKTAELSAKLESEIQLNNKRTTLLTRISSGHEMVRTLQRQIKESEELIAKLESEYIASNTGMTEAELKQLKDSIATADETNLAIQNAKNAHIDFKTSTELSLQVASIEKKIKAIRSRKEEAISKNPLPADGLTFSEDGETLLIDGLPFEDNQIATSKKMIAALQIAKSMLGHIKFLHFDASILDKENADQILKWAEANNLQLGVERALWEGGELSFQIAEHS